MAEAVGHNPVQSALTRVSKRGMTQIVAESSCLGQIFIQTQIPGNGPGNPGYLQRMGQAGTIVIPLRLEKDLRLALKPAKGTGVDDPIHITLETGAHTALPFRALTTLRVLALAGPWKQKQFFCPFGPFSTTQLTHIGTPNSSRWDFVL